MVLLAGQHQHGLKARAVGHKRVDWGEESEEGEGIRFGQESKQQPAGR